MKKLFLCFILLLNACSIAPSGKVLNPKCENVASKIEVFDASHDYVLGTVCRDRCHDRLVVALKKTKDTVYYEGQRITLPKGECINFSDSYTYVSREYDKNAETFIEKTVPLVTFVDKYIDKPEQ